MDGDAEAQELSSSKYASRRKELLLLVKQLRAIGAQADLDLPRIAVIGNQSAGKSSVVEAISGIKVPRDAGTCTRCPMECRLSSSTGPWSCQISIRWEFDDQGKHRDEVKETPFGGTIKNKDDVELALRRAQAAVLNPTVPHHKILLKSAEDLKLGFGAERKPLEFSRNVVCVDLVGPDLTDLSFIDLPGIIQNAEPDVVKLVEDLVVSHIKGNCLILVALPMTDDIENQKALRLARQQDPAGRRTIGVMTKPDMLTAGATKARELWLDIIEGRKHPLLHGYYCTRQPDDAERARDISASDARKAEADFFEKTDPWSKSSQRGRFGTVNLVATLSRLLTQIINDTLPTLDSETRRCLESCEKELSDLPTPIESEPATYLLSIITSFCADVQRFVDGGLDAERLIHENRASYKIFKQAIRQTAPNFLPFTAGHLVDPKFQNYLGDGEDEGPAEGLISGMQPVYLMDMRMHIEKSITRELPDDVPFPAKVQLIKAYQTTWKPSARECFDAVRDSVLKMLTGCVKQKFERFDLLHTQLRSFISELVNQQHNLCSQSLDIILEIESVPFTQNDHYYDSCRDKWLAKYKDARAGKIGVTLERPSKRLKTASSSDVPVSGRGLPATSFSASVMNNAAPMTSPFTFPVPATSPTNQTGAFGSRPKTPAVFGASTVFGTPTLPAQASTAPTAPTVPTVPKKSKTSSTLLTGLSRPSSEGEDSDDAMQPEPPRQQRPQELPKPTQPLRDNPFAPHPALSSTPVASDAFDEEKINSVLASLAEIGYPGLTKEDLGQLHPSDEFARELRVMAQVRAYFQVSYKRVIDNVPLVIDHKFVKAISSNLQPYLISKLGLGTSHSSARCASYLAEDPHVVARRDELIARKKRLESVAAELYKFGL